MVGEDVLKRPMHDGCQRTTRVDRQQPAHGGRDVAAPAPHFSLFPA